MKAWLAGLTVGLILAAGGPGPALAADGGGRPRAVRPVVVMLGDSLIQGGRWAEYFPEVLAHNEGVGGDTVAQVAARLDRALALEPDLLIVMAGINDLGRRAPAAQVIEGHAALWEEIAVKRPGAQLAVLGLLPVIEAKTSFRVSNRDICGINRELQKMARRRNLIFIDLYPLMAGPDGSLKNALTKDGVHLTPAAYDLWRRALQPLIKAAAGQAGRR